MSGRLHPPGINEKDVVSLCGARMEQEVFENEDAKGQVDRIQRLQDPVGAATNPPAHRCIICEILGPEPPSSVSAATSPVPEETLVKMQHLGHDDRQLIRDTCDVLFVPDKPCGCPSLTPDHTKRNITTSIIIIRKLIWPRIFVLSLLQRPCLLALLR
ncbi:hypothetical protein Y1Q_0002641 [Alligator mississippiensis]|uniref:Uncharacterized protein n=1 Tax=Alligator mississippiensis TaxID=8496 RepID=A0A151NZ21_ALLMI|nr:hypothetical protein Y1Q_0002641 [Alligator mississippiensis]